MKTNLLRVRMNVKMTSFIATLFLSVFLLPACRTSPDAAQEQRISNEIRTLLSDMSDSMKLAGLKGWVPFLERAPEFRWSFHGVTIGYDTLIVQIGKEAPLYRSIDLKWDSIRVSPQSTAEIFMTARFAEDLVDTAGVRTNSSGHVKSRVVKTARGWKFLQGETVLDVRSSGE